MLADAEHLYPAVAAGHQQGCVLGKGVDGFLIAAPFDSYQTLSY
jgi:hypothetical protein